MGVAESRIVGDIGAPSVCIAEKLLGLIDPNRSEVVNEVLSRLLGIDRTEVIGAHIHIFRHRMKADIGIGVMAVNVIFCPADQGRMFPSAQGISPGEKCTDQLPDMVTEILFSTDYVGQILLAEK